MAAPKPEDQPDAHVYDPVAVERFLRGRDQVGRKLTHRERREVFRRMRARGDLHDRIQNDLGLNGATFRQWRNDEEGEQSS